MLVCIIHEFLLVRARYKPRDRQPSKYRNFPASIIQVLCLLQPVVRKRLVVPCLSYRTHGHTLPCKFALRSRRREPFCIAAHTHTRRIRIHTHTGMHLYSHTHAGIHLYSLTVKAQHKSAHVINGFLLGQRGKGRREIAWLLAPGVCRATR